MESASIFFCLAPKKYLKYSKFDPPWLLQRYALENALVLIFWKLEESQ
jgi:hypothetical protein